MSWTTLCLLWALVGQDPAAVPVDAPVDAPVAKPELPELRDAVDQTITAEELFAHVSALASDEAAGRFTGSPESQIAVDYMVAKLEALRAHGLEPAGDVIDAATGARSWLQDVHLSKVTFDAIPTMSWDALALEYGSAWTLSDGFGFEGELALVKTELEGAAALTPDAGVALFLDMAQNEPRALVDELGAEWAAGWGALIERGPRTDGRATTDPGRIWRVKAPARPLRLEVRGAGRAALEALDAGTTLTLNVGGQAGKAYNVLAKLPATTTLPGFSSEAVVISAHYDHLRPIPVAEGEDGIFNGADDDASGVAAVLEITEALALSDAPRGRDLVVLLATGEEIGLIGTTYYLDNPVVPLDRTSANLNFEMIGRADPEAGPAGTLWLTGFQNTNLGATLQAEGLAVVDDPRPLQHFFERSDNFAFVLKGVVGQSLSSFNLHEDYHRVTDEADRLEYEHMRLGCEVGLAATRKLLDTQFQVAWSPDYTLPRR